MTRQKYAVSVLKILIADVDWTKSVGSCYTVHMCAIVPTRRASLLRSCTCAQKQRLLCLAFRESWDLIEIRAVKGLANIPVPLIHIWAMLVGALPLRVLDPCVSIHASYSLSWVSAMLFRLAEGSCVRHQGLKSVGCWAGLQRRPGGKLYTASTLHKTGRL